MDYLTSLAIAIIATHCVADFALQTDWMASNKSKHWWPLTAHTIVYTCTFCLFSKLYVWCIFNGLLHWLTDYVTSKITSFCWSKQKIRLFFFAIGVDQFIHYALLFFTFPFFI